MTVFRPRRVLHGTRRTTPGERRCTLIAKLRIWGVLMLTLRTLHATLLRPHGCESLQASRPHCSLTVYHIQADTRGIIRLWGHISYASVRASRLCRRSSKDSRTIELRASYVFCLHVKAKRYRRRGRGVPLPSAAYQGWRIPSASRQAHKSRAFLGYEDDVHC